MSEITLAKGLDNASLTLYAYHLRTDISKGPDHASKDAGKLWERLVELGHDLQIPALQNLKQELICYQEDRYEPAVEKPSKIKRQNLLRSQEDVLEFKLVALTEGKDVKLNGFLCPCLLHDTYALDLTLSHDKNISLDKLGQLNPKGLLLPKSIRASIGQTLLLYGEALYDSDEMLQRLANDCVAKLLGNQTSPRLTGEGKLLGNRIFEYETLEIDPPKRYHILVWFINQNNSTDTDEVSKHLLDFLCAYHKILYAYDNCKSRFHQAEKLYSELEKHINEFQTIALKDRSLRLEKFKELLTKLPTKAIEYSKYLRNLADDETTIATNIKNYESIFKKLSELPDNDLSFLGEFIELTYNKYKAQIQVYRQHLEPGTKLFQQLIDTVRGMVAIDRAELEAQKAERDRINQDKAQKREKRLELIITLVGTGLAVSSISASVISNSSEKFPLVTQNSIVSFLVEVVFHLIVGIVFAIPMGFIVWWNIIERR